MSKGRAIQRENPTYAIETISSIYANVNFQKGPDYYNVEIFNFNAKSQDPYTLIDWIGTGKYSDVFTAKYENKLVAIKVLKPVRIQKYFREAKILTNLIEGPNIIKLLNIVQNPKTQQYSFVFEYVKETPFDFLTNTLTDIECRFYFYQLMRALEYCHSQGIMHRDVKPLNILYDRESKILRLIDWGLADFYHPKKRYNIHVASRNYKPIELLLDYQCYDYSIDIWSFGVTMASIIFKKNPFFTGNDDVDMISKIASVLGGEKLLEYVSKYSLPLPNEIKNQIYKKKAQNWNTFIKKKNKDLANEEAISLIESCIKYDHSERITAFEALKHPYFNPVKDMLSN